jgi:hypothetical protein
LLFGFILAPKSKNKKKEEYGFWLWKKFGNYSSNTEGLSRLKIITLE